MQTDQPSNQKSEGIYGAAVAVADKLSPLCLAAVLLAGIYGYLAYITAKEERAEFHERQLRLIELMDRCWPDEPHARDDG